MGNAIGTSVATKKAEKQITEIEKAWENKNKEDVAALQGELDNALAPKDEVELPWYLVLVNDAHPMKEGYEPKLAYLSEDRYLDECGRRGERDDFGCEKGRTRGIRWILLPKLR